MSPSSMKQSKCSWSRRPESNICLFKKCGCFLLLLCFAASLCLCLHVKLSQAAVEENLCEPGDGHCRGKRGESRDEGGVKTRKCLPVKTKCKKLDFHLINSMNCEAQCMWGVCYFQHRFDPHQSNELKKKNVVTLIWAAYRSACVWTWASFPQEGEWPHSRQEPQTERCRCRSEN